MNRPTWLTSTRMAALTGAGIGAAVGGSQTDGSLGVFAIFVFAVVGATIGAPVGAVADKERSAK